MFLLTGPIQGPFILGTVTDPSGTLTIPFVTPQMPTAGLEGITLLPHPVFLPSGASLVKLGAPTAFVWLED